MTSALARFKTDFLGYLTLLLLCVVIVRSHLLLLCVFFLFVYLFTDVFAHSVHRRFTAVPTWLLFWTFYALLIAVFVFLSVRFVPLFFADFSGYYALFDHDAQRFLQTASARFGISIDYAMLKERVFAEVANSVGSIVKVFNGVSQGFVYFIFTLVLNLLLFFERGPIKAVFLSTPNSLLAYVAAFVVARIKRFYSYFKAVMGGQVIISSINTAITFGAILVLNLPHKISLTVIVFLCGLLPVIGNLVSNTILCITALVSSGPIALGVCLGLLVGIHKLEYFLNSKIIGSIIRLPMFVALLALLLGEATLGLWGMIIAIPLALTIKDELEAIVAGGQ